MLDLFATGYPSIDHIVSVSRHPRTGETALLNDLPHAVPSTWGGCAANVCVALAKLGFRVGLAMRLGDDREGQDYRQYLAALGINVDQVEILDGEKSSHSYLFRNPDGEYQNFFYAGAADVWHSDYVLDGLDARWGLVTVGPRHDNERFLQALTEQNIPLIWQLKADIAAYPPESLVSFVRACRLIFCNHIEAQYLQQGLRLNDLTELFDYGIETIVLTLGEKGSRIIQATSTIEIPAIRTQVVDTTGAGDAYTAGYLAGFLNGSTAETCGRMGAVLAAFCLESVGCQISLPDGSAFSARTIDNFGHL